MIGLASSPSASKPRRPAGREAVRRACRSSCCGAPSGAFPADERARADGSCIGRCAPQAQVRRPRIRPARAARRATRDVPRLSSMGRAEQRDLVAPRGGRLSLLPRPAAASPGTAWRRSARRSGLGERRRRRRGVRPRPTTATLPRWTDSDPSPASHAGEDRRRTHRRCLLSWAARWSRRASAERGPLIGAGEWRNNLESGGRLRRMMRS